METPFYAKSPGNAGYIKNMEVIAHHDADRHYLFQSQLYKTKTGKYYLYGGCYKGYGVEIIDVTDPARPRSVQYISCMDPTVYTYVATPKIQVCDDLLIVSLGNCIEFLHGKAPEKYTMTPGGVQIYSLKEDPEHPKLLSFWPTGISGFDIGVHRFCYNGGRYMHLTASAPGFRGLIYRIVDIQDPTKPVEVGRWWNTDQFLGNQTKETQKRAHVEEIPGPSYESGIHFVFVHDNKAYLSCSGAGFKILDVSNPAVPQVLGELSMCPPFAGKFGGAKCHTFMPIIGRNIAIGTQEGERYWMYSEELQKSMGVWQYTGIEMFDISNPADPVMISIFPYPEVPKDYPYPNFNYCGLKMPGPMGPHNMHEPMSNKPWLENNPNRAYNCYFHAGLRVYDISDPYLIKEIAYFIPPNPEKLVFEIDMANKPLGTTEDLVVDDRGYIFVNALHDGVYILKCLV
ncbi:hypothetical protein AGMMS49546_33820 [Spirochaetia bacterium]|nr:hypothetical protein AGMMS49546_33820 [Spirochaetia bacterium]